MIESYVAYLDRLQKQRIEASATYMAEAKRWCAENLKSDRYEIVEGKCVTKTEDK